MSYYIPNVRLRRQKTNDSTHKAKKNVCDQTVKTNNTHKGQRGYSLII